MRTRLLAAIVVSTALASGCSSDDSSSGPNSSGAGAVSTDPLFVGGISCTNSADSTILDVVDTGTDDTGGDSSTASHSDNQANTEPAVAIDCSADLDRALPGPGVGQTGTG